MLDYIKLIWANNNEDTYEYLLKWFANMVKGIKNSSCLYAKGGEGIGKSTLTDFIRDYVIGRNAYCKGKADHLKGQHNMQLLGKIFVVFEELQVFNDKEWRAVDSEIKDMITDDDGSYTDKYEKRFSAPNINNYVINTNFNAVKGANGRRYVVLDINPCKMNDFEYFKHLHDQCFNNDVGHAFFSYLWEINVDNFNSMDIPVTSAKSDLCADLLTPIEKFLKYKYFLRDISVNKKVKELHYEFDEYCANNKLFTVSIQKFAQNMRELGFNYKPQNGYNTFKISMEELKNIAQKKKWIHDLDKDEMDEVFEDELEKEYLENGVNKTDKRVYQSIDEHILHLKKMILKLEEQKFNEEMDSDNVYVPTCWIGGKTNTKPKKTKPAKVVEVVELDDESEDEEVIRKLVENSKIFWD
jgi:hypothetical protein